MEITLFWRKFQYVANCAFFVLFFGSKIFICAILHAFSISAFSLFRAPEPKQLKEADPRFCTRNVQETTDSHEAWKSIEWGLCSRCCLAFLMDGTGQPLPAMDTLRMAGQKIEM